MALSLVENHSMGLLTREYAKLAPEDLDSYHLLEEGQKTDSTAQCHLTPITYESNCEWVHLCNKKPRPHACTSPPRGFEMLNVLCYLTATKADAIVQEISHFLKDMLCLDMTNGHCSHLLAFQHQ